MTQPLQANDNELLALTSGRRGNSVCMLVRLQPESPTAEEAQRCGSATGSIETLNQAAIMLYRELKAVFEVTNSERSLQGCAGGLGR